MIRLLGSFAWLRFRLLLNTFKRRRRDSFETLSAMAAIVVPVVILIFFLAGAGLFGLLGYLAGTAIGSGRVDHEALIVALRMMLMMLVVIVLVFPIGRGAHASLAAHPRLMLLPIPRRLLHGLEVATTVADPWILIAVPGLVLLPAGILQAGRVAAGVVMFLAGAAFLASIVSMTAFVSYAVQFLLRDRRRGEIATLVGAIALILLALAPAALSGSVATDDLKVVIGQIGNQVWLGVLPSELYARAATQALERGLAGGLVPLTALLAEAALLYVLSGMLFAKLIGSAETGRSRRQSLAFPRLPEIPMLSPGAAGVAVIQSRAALRTIKGKLSIFTPGPLTLLFGLILPGLPALRPVAHMAQGQGHVLLGLAGLFCLLSIHPILLNQFAIDRSGLSLLFVSPLGERELLLGKAIGGAALFAMAFLPCLAAAVFLLPGGSPFLWASTVFGLIAAYALMAPPSAILSAFFPKLSNLNTMGSAGNPHPLASLLGFLLTLIACVPSSLITGIAGTLLDRPVLALGLSIIWAALAVAIASPLMNVAAIMLAERRENLAATAR